MGLANNTGFGPPPLGTPITGETGDQFGVPFQNRPKEPVPAGNLAIGWAAWFSGLYANAKNWVRLLSSTQANLAALALTLYPADAGVIVNVTDYGHILQWTGSAWQWGPGEQGSGMLVLFEVDPTGSGWHLYDGSANVPYLKSDGTTGTKTLPDLTSAANLAAYLKAGSPNGGPNAAVAPTFNGTAMGTHQHEVAFSEAGGFIVSFANIFGIGGGTRVPNTRVAAGAFATPTFCSLTSAVSAGTPAGTITNDGEPRNLIRRAWFRQ